MLALASGCLSEGPVETSETAQSSFVLLGNIFQNGTLVSFDDITNVSGIDLTRIVGLTACDPKALYAVEKSTGASGIASYKLWFSNTSGQSWTAQATAGKSAEIACDHAQLATLDASKQLFVAPLQANGNVGTWAQLMTSVKVDRIQGGDGSIYGVKAVATGRDVYVASAKSVLAPLDWGSPIANIGATQVTGTGATRTGSDNRAVGNTLAWSRRAFALELDGTISTNPTLLDGQNWWTGLNSGSERYLTLTAAAPNLLFGIQNKNGVNHVNRIRIDETSCFDGVDNDANGLTDGEDPACVKPAADSFCSAHANGNYCANRFQPSWFNDQANQNASLITCTNHVATITPGVCVDSPSGPGFDSLQSLDALTPTDPPKTSHYCNVHWPDGTWGFDYGHATPCAILLNSKPGGKIVRAGLYSITGANNVFVACNNGWYGPVGSAGADPLLAAYTAVGHTANACIFQVTATALPVFGPQFNLADQLPYPGRVALPFVHNLHPVDLAQFGNGQTGPSAGVDRFGMNVGAREPAYDHPLDEARPLYAVSGGVVITNGSRIRDVSIFGCGGTPNQGELWIKYSVGSDATYRESFVVGYMHVRKRLVADGQTVKAGQIVGYIGATGCTGGYAHLHSSVARLSNNNAHTAAQPEFGYRFPFQANTDPTGSNEGGFTAIDALGWANFSAFDPRAYAEWNTAAISYSNYGFTGVGAWSVNLFKPGSAFRYP
jgi:murein DD-endopeptidase MepM/ murein hydrolase activator NlpD